MFFFIAAWKRKTINKIDSSDILWLYLLLLLFFYSGLLIAWFMTVDLFACQLLCFFLSFCVLVRMCMCCCRENLNRSFLFLNFFSFFSRTLSNAKVHKPINQNSVLLLTVTVFHTKNARGQQLRSRMWNYELTTKQIVTLEENQIIWLSETSYRNSTKKKHTHALQHQTHINSQWPHILFHTILFVSLLTFLSLFFRHITSTHAIFFFSR